MHLPLGTARPRRPDCPRTTRSGPASSTSKLSSPASQCVPASCSADSSWTGASGSTLGQTASTSRGERSPGSALPWRRPKRRSPPRKVPGGLRGRSRPCLRGPAGRVGKTPRCSRSSRRSRSRSHSPSWPERPRSTKRRPTTEALNGSDRARGARWPRHAGWTGLEGAGSRGLNLLTALGFRCPLDVMRYLGRCPSVPSSPADCPRFRLVLGT